MIKPWHRNGIASGIKARIPFRNGIRSVVRRFRGYSPPEGNDDYYLGNAVTIVRAARRTGKPMRGAYLEIGTGWTPIMSMVFYIAGFDKINLCDLDPYLDEEGVARAKMVVAAALQDVSAAAGVSVEAAKARIASYQYTYHCPCDLGEFAAESIDLAASRAVLEHVPSADLATLHTGIANTLKTGGLAIHFVDNSDHFEHIDKSISKVNFLRYTNRAWSVIETLTATSQNRLRHSDHIQILKHTGLEIIHEEGMVDGKTLEALTSLNLAAPFADKPAEDLATLTSLFVLEKRAPPMSIVQ